MPVDSSFLKELADRCRTLAENTDQFTKRRLLDLAAKYDDRSGRPSRALLTLRVPGGESPAIVETAERTQI